MFGTAISPELYLAYVAACIAIVIVPGPTVTVVIANSLRHGARAGLLNVAGTQAGLAIMVGVLAAGLHVIVASLAQVFDVVRLAGAAYLVWLGIKLWRSDGTLGAAAGRGRAGGSFFWQGFVVILSNPKALFFFGAFIPQFINTSRQRHRPDAGAGGDLHGRGDGFGRRLCAAGRRGRAASVADASKGAGNGQRHLPHRRRHLAGAAQKVG